MSDLEKTDVSHIERTVSGKSQDSNDARINALTPEQQKKVIRRIDARLVLTCGFMYCVSLMDRTNTGIAVVAGMGVDLVLIDARYSIIVLVFFLTYSLLQPPATVVLRKVGPRIFLPSITILWGITMICIGFIKTWLQMIPLRLVLGIFEAGFFPGKSLVSALLTLSRITDNRDQVAHTSFRLGIHVTNCRSATPYFT